jgi:hypothetical protein
MNMNNYCYNIYKLSAWSMRYYSNKDFLIAKQFEMKEEVSFKMGYDLLFNKIFILFSALLINFKFSVFDTLS